jgi:hypothetical protein
VEQAWQDALDADGRVPGAASGAEAEEAPEPPGLTFCFGSAGWLFVYYMGVIKCLKELDLHKNAHCISCSGGALAAAAGFCCNVDMDKLKSFVLDCAADARKYVPPVRSRLSFVRPA